METPKISARGDLVVGPALFRLGAPESKAPGARARAGAGVAGVGRWEILGKPPTGESMKKMGKSSVLGGSSH